MKASASGRNNFFSRKLKRFLYVEVTSLNFVGKQNICDFEV